jgi:hypothetical protein
LYYLNSRFYNPLIGRFISSDAVLGSIGSPLGHNIYSYSGNDPINRIDESGYKWNWNKIGKVALIATVAVVTVVAIAATAGGAAAIAGPMLAAYTGGILGASSVYATGAVLAGATLAFAANDINTELSGTNVVAEKMLNGNETLYNNLNTGNKIASGVFIGIGLIGNYKINNYGKNPVTNANGYNGSAAHKTRDLKDTLHSFSKIIDNYAPKTPTEIYSNGTSLYTVEGNLNGTDGTFEWMVNNLGEIVHRFFNPMS